MTDTYQAIYDAVRSKILGGDIGHVIHEVAWRQLDISHTVAMLNQEFSIVAAEMQRPSVLYAPGVTHDGSKWTATYWGVSGIGNSPDAAMRNFDKNWSTPLAGESP